MNKSDGKRKGGEVSKHFNLFVLRRLYNPEHGGRGVKDEVHRKDLRVTLTPITKTALGRVVRLGRGGFASPVVELAVRTLTALTAGSFQLKVVAEELALATKNRGTLVANLRALADQVEAYQGEGRRDDLAEAAEQRLA